MISVSIEEVRERWANSTRSGRKEIIKIIIKFDEIESRQKIEKINKAKSERGCHYRSYRIKGRGFQEDDDYGSSLVFPISSDPPHKN